jgi:anti-anti-sigma factor
MTEPSSIQIETRAGNVAEVVVVRGDLDLTTTDELSHAIDAAGGSALVLDLSDLQFVDSAGIRAIDQARRRRVESGGTLVVVAPPDSRAAWTFRVAGFGESFVAVSLEAALRRAALPPGSSDGSAAS